MPHASNLADKTGSQGRKWVFGAGMVGGWRAWRYRTEILYTSVFRRKVRFFRHFFQPLDGAEPFR
jgi:hypothetical protein